MPVEIFTTTQDNYSDATSLGGSQQFDQVLFAISTPYAAKYQVAKLDRNGKVVWDTNDLTALAGEQGGYTQCYGIRFKSFTPGQAATLLAIGIFSDDPIPSGFQLSDSSFNPSGGGGSGSPSKVSSGQVTGTHGTPTALVATSSVVLSVVVKADPNNVGNIYLGGAGVNTSDGYILSPGDAVAFDITNLDTIEFDVDNTGDGVSWLATSV